MESSFSSPSSSSSCRFKLYDLLELQEFQDKYVIKSVDYPNRGFSIDRRDGNIESLTDDSVSGTPSKTSKIYGVAGTIRLIAGTYVLVITSRKEVGAFLGSPVFRIMSMKFLSCNEALRFSTPQEKRDEAFFLNLLKTVESTPGLYYSYETDITLNLQRRCKLAEGWMAKPIWKQADPRFVWNKNLLEELIECKSKIVERHFHDLHQRYGDTVAVDLTDKHGDEGKLSLAYAAEAQKLPNVRYVSFDFHHICGNSNFDNLQILYDQISEEFQKQGYFIIDAEEKILEEQKGIIRSNCIDCLDRTNVTQSYLAQKSLTAQMQRIGVLASNECISMFSEDYGKFRRLWAEQGDEISLEYTGTYALKGDLVRYGRQTLRGIIKDGMSALSRYYLNNFQDGVRQDALDLISGHYTVNRNGPSPFQLNGFESLSYLPVASALVIGGLTLTSFTLQQAGRNVQCYLSTVLWAGVTTGVIAVVKVNGRQFCSRPRLCGLL
ncbi:hypothetical protein P3X46_008784 [Hevea brasiliensis]|uniref:SAC domain-containing protein n=1 Tax=Hevea brasiliensis TaxID=3981 RepID=A0ABQ9MMG2_HEVBR|nr:hypothetical protein P3X46_008784 [Hevea brasiliensis]